MRPVIEIENLSKLYFLEASNNPTLVDSVGRWWSRFTNKNHREETRLQKNGVDSKELNWGPKPNSFWALKDVSLTVEPGEVVGLLGRNGSGKSTFLRILSKITSPTSGHARLRGRVSSILELGTGFHHNLTGRENVYLNGIFLGMNRRGVDRKLNEIISFAELGKFIDAPLKHYSAGMHARLAFSVAAHLDPEILLLDEVLAVGDALFQKKCIDKIREMAGRGLTVVFASHSTGVIRELCSSVLFLEKGFSEKFPDCETAIKKYEDKTC